MMYDREHAPGEIKLRFHIRDRFANDILNSLRYDPQSGKGYRRGKDGREQEYFSPGGYVEIDGIVNPSDEQYQSIVASVRSHLSREVMDAVSRKVIEDARLRNNNGLASIETTMKMIGLDKDDEDERQEREDSRKNV